jgi:hypothetical protein
LDRAEIGTIPGFFTVVAWLSNWLCFQLLWKPPWQVPASVEFIDDGISWVLFLAIAPIYGYWTLKWFLALSSWPVPMDKEMVLGYLIWNIHTFSCNCSALIDARSVAILRSYIARVSHQHIALGSSDVRDSPSVMLLKHPWPPPVLLHLPQAGVVLWPLQWPFFYSYAADRKSKLLLFRESDKKPYSIPKLAEGLKCLILWFSVQLTTGDHMVG